MSENDEKIKFAYSNSNAYQNSHEIEDELELWWDKNSLKKFCNIKLFLFACKMPELRDEISYTINVDKIIWAEDALSTT